MQSSIRSRLTAWYVAALALTLFVLGGATVVLTRANLYHWLDESLEERAEVLSDQVRLVDGEPRLTEPEESKRDDDGIGSGYLLLDGSGRVLLARGMEGVPFRRADVVTAALGGRPATGTVAASGERQWRLISRPLFGHGKVAGVLLVGHDLDEIDEVMARLTLVMLALLPLGLAAAGAGGYAVASRALAPVDQITRAASEISERDLSRRLPVRAKDELGRLAFTFNALVERLQQAFERQRRFTADASHELRTPLAVVRAITSQKLMHRRTPEEYEGALRQIDEAAAYMAKLTTHLLTLARADAHPVELSREPVELAELLEHAAAQVGEAAGRSIPVHAAGSVEIMGDPVRLTELFLNLLENAAKYTPPEGTIEVRVRMEGTQAQVVVRDTGIGIPPEDLPHVFERFYRIDKARAREQGGAGLGLAIALWVAEAHGGSLRAESRPGQGTTMTVTLPAAGEEPRP